MPSLLERLREVLAPRYEVEAEVASGGMATVFRALDTSLDRIVAVKVLRPDMATATGEARFLREARTLAAFSHPNMVTIHDADQRGGLSYYVMDLVDGETLRQRLERGPLDGRDAFRLGRDLLEVLERIHDAGIIHRDVKPSNIFLVDHRALLADFGIVHIEGPVDETLTTDRWGPGTPAYMSPEQAKGEPVSAPSDLYSLGMVLYEALAGKRWISLAAPESGDWSQIPVVSRPVLKKALAVDPADRWQSAREFRGALRTRRQGIRFPRWAVAAAAAGIVALGGWALIRSVTQGPSALPAPHGLLDVAVFPCDATDPDDRELASNIGWRTNLNLDGLPGIGKASSQAAFSLYENRGGALSPSDWTGVLRASHAVRCVVDRVQDGLDVDFRLLDESGNVVELETLHVAGDSEDSLLRQAAVAVTLQVVGAVVPDLTVTEEEVDRFSGYRIETLRPFFWGDFHLRNGAWRSAAAAYGEALAADPTFTLARLRRAEVHRWLVDRSIGANLDSILAMDLSSLSPLDSLLMVAGAKPHGPEQLEAYEAILALPAYQFDPYATLLYADELYHRGALWGVPLDSAVTMLHLAVARDSFLVPAVEHLTQALIRTGQAEDAATMLEHLGDIHAPEDESDLFYPRVWRQGWLEKFDPGTARETRAAMAALPPETVSLYARWVRYIDSPSTQVELGRLLLGVAEHLGSRDLAAQAFVAQGLGRVAQGMIPQGLAAFDSAAGRFETPETLAQAAEWAVIPYALGVEGFNAPDADRGQRMLEGLWQRADIDLRIKVRAATALALLADRRGDEGLRDAWANRLESLGLEEGGGTARPYRLASALGSAARGDYRGALDSTAEDYLAYDSVGLADRPFLRSALHLKRGEWYRALGMRDSAIASWLWHQNTDLEGMIPPPLIQAGEVDAALGPYAARKTIGASSAEGPE